MTNCPPQYIGQGPKYSENAWVAQPWTSLLPGCAQTSRLPFSSLPKEKTLAGAKEGGRQNDIWAPPSPRRGSDAAMPVGKCWYCLGAFSSASSQNRAASVNDRRFSYVGCGNLPMLNRTGLRKGQEVFADVNNDWL
jgi:hypothetical protein